MQLAIGCQQKLAINLTGHPENSTSFNSAVTDIQLIPIIMQLTLTHPFGILLRDLMNLGGITLLTQGGVSLELCRIRFLKNHDSDSPVAFSIFSGIWTGYRRELGKESFSGSQFLIPRTGRNTWFWGFDTTLVSQFKAQCLSDTLMHCCTSYHTRICPDNVCSIKMSEHSLLLCRTLIGPFMILIWQLDGVCLLTLIKSALLLSDAR